MQKVSTGIFQEFAKTFEVSKYSYPIIRGVNLTSNFFILINTNFKAKAIQFLYTIIQYRTSIYVEPESTLCEVQKPTLLCMLKPTQQHQASWFLHYTTGVL